MLREQFNKRIVHIMLNGLLYYAKFLCSTNVTIMLKDHRRYKYASSDLHDFHSLEC